MDATIDSEALTRAARAVFEAEALLFTAGAGMGVDSGLPDFRGPEGFWRAYPAYQKLGLSFSDLADPRWFERDPTLAWGFYGHRLGLYRRTRPHAGFDRLLEWGRSKPGGYAVFTSNVDGAFSRAGFDPERVLECHGSIHHAQCTAACGVGIFSADRYDVTVDEATFRARPPLPACPRCGELARPNILMFGDGDWDESRTAAQHARMGDWLSAVRGRRVTIVECGAGTAIPSVRNFGERLARASGVTLVRINVREAGAPAGAVELAAGALRAITEIDRAVRELR